MSEPNDELPVGVTDTLAYLTKLLAPSRPILSLDTPDTNESSEHEVRE